MHLGENVQSRLPQDSKYISELPDNSKPLKTRVEILHRPGCAQAEHQIHIIHKHLTNVNGELITTYRLLHYLLQCNWRDNCYRNCPL